MKNSGRPRRVGLLIQKEIAALLTNGLKDPRVGFVSVMSVRMSSDLHYANVYVSLYGEEKERKSSLIALRNSAGWIRRELGKHLTTRVTPEIRFFPDETLDQVYHLQEIFDDIHRERKEKPMNHVDLETIVEEFREAQSFLLTAHNNPDGDAVGSMLALYHFLKALGKQDIACVLDDPVPKIYATLPGANTILRCEDDKPDYDLAVILDVSSFERIGDVAEWIGDDKKIVVLDHHQEDNPVGSIGFIDTTYAAVGEIVAELFEVANIPLSPEAAHCAYIAQITDTGGYRYSNTNARSHRIAARLLDTGLDTATICSDIFERISRPKFKLLQRVLHRHAFLCQDRATHSYVTSKDLDETDAKKEDLNGLINHLKNIEGIEVGILFNAVTPDLTKVSLRSTLDFNAAKFLGEFGGGGHAAAAGATIEAPIEEARQRILERLEITLGEKV